MAELEASGLPAVRCPYADGTYPPGAGPQVHDHSELAQLVALGRAAAICPASARSWLWAEHAAVPLTDALQVTTHIAWMRHNRSREVHELVRTAILLSPPPGGSPGITTRSVLGRSGRAEARALRDDPEDRAEIEASHEDLAPLQAQA